MAAAVAATGTRPNRVLQHHAEEVTDSPPPRGPLHAVLIRTPLILPVLMGQWRAIQLFTARTPLRHQFIHQITKPIIVVPLKEVNHFMYQDVLQA